MKKILFSILLFSSYIYLTQAVLKMYTEHETDYLVVKKKKMSFKFFYENPIGERDLHRLTLDELNQTLEFCDELELPEKLTEYCSRVMKEKLKNE